MTPYRTRTRGLCAAAFLLPLALLAGCGGLSSAPPAVCNETGTPFQTAYAVATATTGASEHVTLDLMTHEYSFQANTAMTICSVGYQAVPRLVNSVPTIAAPYLIELIDVGSATTLYSGTHNFSTTATSYVPLPTPVVLTPGNTYTLRRTVNNFNGDIGNTIGRLVDGQAGHFPINPQGPMTIISTNFYGTGGPVPNSRVPYIDFGTQ